MVGKKLQKSKDIKVIFTRKKDVFIDLWKRGEIANKAKADLFVSIHCDSYKPRPSAHGAGTFVLGLRGKIAIIGIAKRLEEIYYPGDSIPMYLDKKSETLKIIQFLRNEAHRFGITFHRNKRSMKDGFTLNFNDIPGNLIIHTN